MYTLIHSQCLDVAAGAYEDFSEIPIHNDTNKSEKEIKAKAFIEDKDMVFPALLDSPLCLQEHEMHHLLQAGMKS